MSSSLVTLTHCPPEPGERERAPTSRQEHYLLALPVCLQFAAAAVDNRQAHKVSASPGTFPTADEARPPRVSVCGL